MAEEKVYVGYHPTTFVFDGYKLPTIDEDGNEVVPENTTTIEPVGFMGTPKFDVENNAWVGQTVEEWQKEQAAIPVVPDDATKQIAALTLVLATEKNNNAKNVAVMMQQMAVQAKAIQDLQNGGTQDV